MAPAVVEYITGVVTSCLGCRTSNDCLGTSLCVAWVSVLVIVVTGDDTGSATGSVTGMSGIPNGNGATNKHDRTLMQNRFAQNVVELY